MRETITGSILTIIGVIMLIYSFMSLRELIGNIIAPETLIINIILISFMVGIGGYLTGKGVSLLRGEGE